MNIEDSLEKSSVESDERMGSLNDDCNSLLENQTYSITPLNRKKRIKIKNFGPETNENEISIENELIQPRILEIDQLESLNESRSYFS